MKRSAEEAQHIHPQDLMGPVKYAKPEGRLHAHHHPPASTTNNTAVHPTDRIVMLAPFLQEKLHTMFSQGLVCEDCEAHGFTSTHQHANSNTHTNRIQQQ